MSPAADPEAPILDPAATRPLTPHVALRSVTLLVNPLSGSTGPGAVERATALLAAWPLESRVIALEGENLEAQIGAALAERPDLLAVLAGDGTARAAAGLAGPDGPLIAPLPGGTMNMLPKALYGTTDWVEALTRTLESGAPQDVSGGDIDGHTFYCAAILGSPALWAPAREAVRKGRLDLAWSHARKALRRAFGGRVRYRLDGGPVRRAEALALLCPLISRALHEAEDGLEAAALSPTDAAEAFRLAYHALTSDWRHDPSVLTAKVRSARVEARSRIPAVLDGESVLLAPRARVRFTPRAFRALAPRPSADETQV
ncbi:MAG TPA: diacylglycerol kinase family protein [Brevundimonas sp.]|jgi:diacylglycerol kinase family enzyme|uniref:diacylglycerol/lipid kinase family protein n=1 Tax=Brevundimonas sp. TaxID=1871086 RepID=UPI002E157531|nr:diacylglycerol kinase family protein [Brevundimonas sp.]